MKSSTRVPLFVFTLISAAVLYAQTAPKPFVWAALQPALMQTVPPTTAPVGDALPQISELERTKLENLQLKFQMLQQQTTATSAELLRAHPPDLRRASRLYLRSANLKPSKDSTRDLHASQAHSRR